MSDLYIGYKWKIPVLIMEIVIQNKHVKPDPWKSSFYTDMCMKWQDNLQVKLTSRHASCQN